MEATSSPQDQEKLFRYPLSGNCKGRFALLSVDKEWLRPFLPQELELAPQSFTPETKHPLLLMFNYMHLHLNDNLKEKTMESAGELALNYNEFIVMIPYVQFVDNIRNDEAIYCFLPVLYLDSILAVIGGRIFWEFNKQMASFTTSDTIFNISDEISGASYFYSNFDKGSTFVPAKSEPNFLQIEPMLSLPVIEYGKLGYVTSTYVIEYENALINPSSVTVSNISCRYLPSGDFTILPISQESLGAFYMDYNWKLSFIKFIKL